ncbi:MAG: glycosyltransferase, partial [Gemmatimonadaceae bacterium]
ARRASAIVAVSAGVAERLIRNGAPPALVHVIRNAMSSTSHIVDRAEARERLGRGSGQQIGWIGRLSSEKGPDVMLAAMAQLADLDVNLSFVGDGPDLVGLTQRAEEMGIAARIRFHGRVPAAGSLLRAFDVIALSSRTEGTPMVILEAMSSQVPIVATQVGGVPDMLSPTEALLVPPDNPTALANALRSALADGAASAIRASRAYERLISEFDVDAWLAKYEALYRSIQPANRKPNR